MNDAVAEPVLVDERQIGARIGRQCGGAPADDDWPGEQGQLVDEAGDESLRCQVRAPINTSLSAAALRSRTALAEKWRSSRVFDA